jgi:hypothetical protein
MKALFTVVIMLSASLAWSSPGQTRALRDLSPDKTVCVCSFALKGADEANRHMVFWLGIIGAAINSTRPDSPHRQGLSAGFRSAFEEALSGTGAFQLLSSGRLVGEKNGKSLSLSDAPAENTLSACL